MINQVLLILPKNSRFFNICSFWFRDFTRMTARSEFWWILLFIHRIIDIVYPSNYTHHDHPAISLSPCISQTQNVASKQEISFFLLFNPSILSSESAKR
jgi:hypothetical protein